MSVPQTGLLASYEGSAAYLGEFYTIVTSAHTVSRTNHGERGGGAEGLGVSD